MRRIVAIQVKSGVAITLWLLGALCVTAEVRQPGFWYEKVGALKRSGDRVIAGAPGQVGGSGDLAAPTSGNLAHHAASQNAQPSSPEPAYQNNEVAAEQQASQTEADPPDPATNAHTRLIVISIPDRQLALLQDGQLVKVYPIAVGAKHSPSPEGEYTVINHSVNPTYRHKDVKILPGKGNPLGTRWMGLSLKGYGIHGTNVQSSVGKAASHGCFRMKKKDVEELYELVQVGDVVSVRAQRDELTMQLFTTPASTVIAKSDTPKPDVRVNKVETEVASAVPVATAASSEQ